jgi:hypothetical protein
MIINCKILCNSLYIFLVTRFLIIRVFSFKFFKKKHIHFQQVSVQLIHPNNFTKLKIESAKCLLLKNKITY